MAEIVNLRRVRKQKARADQEVKAAENRTAFGRRKADRDLSDANNDLAARRLEAHKRDEPTS